MTVYYLDTSAIIKRYREEKGTDVVDQLIDHPLTGDRFYTSFLSVLELTSGVMRLTQSNRLKENEAREIIARFREDLRTHFRVWPIDNDITTSAVGIVEEYKLRAADAIHMATALAIFSALSGQHPLLVTSDREMLEAVKSSHHGALDPQEVGSLDRLLQLRASQV
ncbi:MAG: type II toxin-antitoxin system VapC family toxin [Chloroflexi bacterium]|nr:type II toxin-antitoxin system VapC family toxin [Chloroflexota bacterium]